MNFFLILIPVSADSFLDDVNWATRGSIFYFAGQGADPAPFLPSLGFSAVWQSTRLLRLEFTEDLYFTNYEYNSMLEYAMPCNPENRSAFVMGFVTGFQLTGAFPIGKNGTGLRLYGGPAADLRLVVLAFGLHPDNLSTGDIKTDARLQTDAIRKYFWNEGRWFFPAAGMGMDFPINEKYLLGFDLRTWFPVYRLWTDKDLPAVDGWRFGVGLRLTPRKKPASREAISAEAAAPEIGPPETDDSETGNGE
ncbi:MAG: hypothetical protein LBI04_12170 [Treponema sp.]|nr:hypothetical protein [Treponema sp.]